MKLLCILLQTNIKMKTKNILALSFFAISIVLILVGSINVFDGYITGKVTGSSSGNITSIGGFGELLDAGLISTNGDCESLGALQNANLISEDGEKKLHHGTVEFSEEDCQADISELIKNDRQIEVEGVSVSREKGADSYMLEATSEDKEGFVNVDGKKVYLKKGDSIKLDSENGKIEKGSFSVKESTNFDFGPLSANIDEGEVNYNSNDKMLKLPSGSEIEMIDATELNNIMGESNTFDINGEDIEMSSNVYNGLLSFSPERADKFSKFSGNLRLNKPTLKETGMEMKYIASIPKKKSLSFPEAGVKIGSSSSTDTHLFFNQDNYFKEREINGETQNILGTSDYYLKEIGGRSYISLTDNEISGRSFVASDTAMRKITFNEGSNVAGFDIKEGQYLQTKFANNFNIKEGNVHVSKGNFKIENGADRIIRSGGDLQLDLLGGEKGKRGVDFDIFNSYSSGGEKKLIHGRVGNQLGENSYISNFQLVDESLEYRRPEQDTKGYVGGVKIVNRNGGLFDVKTSKNKQGHLTIDLLNSDDVPRDLKILLRNQINSQRAPPGYRYIKKF